MKPNNQSNIEQQLSNYMRGESSAQDSAAVEAWLHTHIADPGYDTLFERLLEQTPADTDREGMLRARRRIEGMIAAGEQPHKTPVRPLRRILRLVEYAAVAAMLIVALTLYLRPAQHTEWLVEYADMGQTRQITLPDSTRIWLNSGSRIIYPSRFDAEARRVYIDGEIFADVAKDAKHPFIVSASGVAVRVLGTQFGMKSYAQNPNVEVALIEGSVAMQAEREGETVDCTLTPGDLVRYNRTSGEMEAYRIDTLSYGSWHTNRNLCFINQTLGDIAADLERRFDVKIVIRDAQLSSVQYYASFVNNETLDQILRTLNSGNTMRISRINDTIILSSK